MKFIVKNLKICQGECNFAALSNEKVYRTTASLELGKCESDVATGECVGGEVILLRCMC